MQRSKSGKAITANCFVYADSPRAFKEGRKAFSVFHHAQEKLLYYITYQKLHSILPFRTIVICDTWYVIRESASIERLG